MVLRGSLSLLGMECGFLRLQIGDHFLCSINRELITDCEQYPPIALNGVVDIRTLFTHHCRLFRRMRLATCHILTMTAAFCFNRKLERFNCRPVDLWLSNASASERHGLLVKTDHSFERSSD